MVKAVVAGAAGGIGQPLSLLLKLSPYVDELALFDVVNSPGVAADLSHISTAGKVEGFLKDKDQGIDGALKGADIVVIPAGIPRKPGMTRDDLFKINAGIVRDIIEGVARNAPKAFILIISNPVNSTVPIAAEILKKHGVFDPKRLFGVTSLDSVRAETFTSSLEGGNPKDYYIPVVGGHSGETIVPLLSQATPKQSIDGDKRDKLIHRIQFGGDEVVQAKDGAGSATLSMAYAGYIFAEAVLKGLKGEKSVAPAYVFLEGIEGGKAVRDKVGVDFFALPVTFGKTGAESVEDVLASATEYEQGLLKVAIDGLKGNISKGVAFITDSADSKL